MGKYQKTKVISLPLQLAKLTKVYSNISDATIRNGRLSFNVSIKPLETSESYLIHVEYIINLNPRAYLISPPLKQYNGKNPHHIFETNENGQTQLCFYNTKFGEWNKSMYLADTIVPWLTSWLFAYEIWQITGQWHYDEAPTKK